MKKVLLIVLLAAIAFVAVVYFYEGNTTKATWLHGNWEMSYDPDNNPKDFLEFKPDGTVLLKSTPSKSDARCQYVIKIGHVNLVCMVRGEYRTIAMEVAGDQTQLVNPTGAVYTRP
jgi:hypothetical protein